jgi:HD-GYP domain-containing protein (c-di-GMP phosphodiesterase class II)
VRLRQAVLDSFERFDGRSVPAGRAGAGALAGFGDASDLKNLWFTGHSRGVAGLARAAAEQLSPADVRAVYRAGLAS